MFAEQGTVKEGGRLALLGPGDATDKWVEAEWKRTVTQTRAFYAS